MKYFEKENQDAWDAFKGNMKTSKGIDVDELLDSKKKYSDMTSDEQAVYDERLRSQTMDRIDAPSQLDRDGKLDKFTPEITKEQGGHPYAVVPAEEEEGAPWYSSLDWSGFKLPEGDSVSKAGVKMGSVNAKPPEWLMNPAQTAPRMMNVDTALAQSMNRRRLRGLNLNSYGW